MLRAQATALDRLLVAVSEEYSREAKSRPGSPEQRRVRQIERLLAGELVDTSPIGYDFDAHHIGVVAVGRGTRQALRDLAGALDRSLLLLPRGEDSTWAWLGGRRPFELEQIERAVSKVWPKGMVLAIGEPDRGLGGWRLSHRQAQAAFPVAVRGSSSLTRYADVALLAATLQDDLLATSLRRLYLEPLASQRDGGETLRQTLRAYFSCERNVSSAAVTLGVDRRTVSSRLRAVETRIGNSLDECASDVQMALSLDELDRIRLA